MSATYHKFDTLEKVSEEVFQWISCHVNLTLKHKSKCHIALPGGNTPHLLIKKIGGSDLPFDRLEFMVTDERWVEAESEMSNYRMLRKLMPRATVHSLYDGTNLTDSVATLEGEFRSFEPFDIVVVGMGVDGHFASIFPDGTTTVGKFAFCSEQSPQRLSWSSEFLASSSNIAVFFVGEEKSSVLSQSSLDLPIHRFITMAPEVEVFHA